MTAIIDYGVGNLFSLTSSFAKIGEEVVVTNQPGEIERADRILLPGVGAFCDAAEKLRQSGLIPVLEAEIAKGKPLMGVCLGMQLLFDRSFEYGAYDGLGWIRGEVRAISDYVQNLKIPHMGWNAISLRQPKHPLFKYIEDGDYVYFVHSFCAVNCAENVIAATEYGAEITAAVANGNVMGCQFHPEKSGDVGLKILRAFCEMKEGALC